MRYQVPRDVLLRIWWRRTILRPRILLTLSIWTALGTGLLLLLDRDVRYGGLVFLLFAALTPVSVYRSLAAAIDRDSTLTDPRTLEFGPQRLVVSGPDWRNEMTLRKFRRFSEDEDYFYLHLGHDTIVSVFPKSAFSPALQENFRQLARDNIL